MKKIINGKKYDTDTAIKLAIIDNGCYYNDFYYHCERLYKKKTGEFFLHKEWSRSQEIVPISETKAKEWAEQLDGDEYEKIFGEVDE